MTYAEVAVDTSVEPGRTFTYSIPSGLDVSAGQGVEVPFGPRVLQGILFGLTSATDVEGVRPIASILDANPWLSPAQLEVALWISTYYRSSLFEAAALMMPPRIRQKPLAIYTAEKDPPKLSLDSLEGVPEKVYKTIKDRESIGQREVAKRFGQKASIMALGQLVRKHLLKRTWASAKPTSGPKFATKVKLKIGRHEALRLAKNLAGGRSRKQAHVLEELASLEEGLPLAEVINRAGLSRPTLTAMVKKGLVELEQVRVTRDPLAGRTYELEARPKLTPMQTGVWETLSKAIDGALSGKQVSTRPPVFLLQGVTGSGKTELYLRALEKMVAGGRRGIVLVPEIALTPQTIQRFSARFPGEVAVLHSRLSAGEMFDEWWRIREGQFKVVIGSRSAVFAPQPDLGLIVIDEEHEWTFKQQDQQPHYHTRDVAIRLAEKTGALVVLGSATPDIGSYHLAKGGEYKLLELSERIVVAERGGTARASPLPSVEVVDLRTELKSGNRSIFSRSLAKGIRSALDAKQQVVLFLNRRGSATFVQCRNCGFVLRCPRCDTSLTYHLDIGLLMCHHCNAKVIVPKTCPICWSPRIRYLGIGTQKVEEEARQAFPDAGILRWDRDVAKSWEEHEEILRKFQAHEADILVGTQMIAKGLHMPLVTLVGVVSADVGLHMPDFRAAERVFQVLCQVAGRSGRGPSGGKVVIQTYTPEHYAILAAAAQDYRGFYDQEVEFRKKLGYPPFSRLVRLVYTNPNTAKCQREAERMHQTLKGELQSAALPGTNLIGPAPAPYERVRGRYRWHIVVRGPEPVQLVSRVRIPDGWSVDVDPLSLL